MTKQEIVSQLIKCRRTNTPPPWELIWGISEEFELSLGEVVHCVTNRPSDREVPDHLC